MRILIVYSSKTGTTEKAARKLADLLKLETDLTGAKDFGSIDLSRYDAVVVGSAVRIGSVLKDSKNLVSRNLVQLLERKLAVFLCMGEDKTHLDEYLARSYPQEFLDACLVKGHFGGEINIDKLGFIMRILMKKMMKDKEPPKLLEENIEAFAKEFEEEIASRRTQRNSEPQQESTC